MRNNQRTGIEALLVDCCYPFERIKKAMQDPLRYSCRQISTRRFWEHLKGANAHTDTHTARHCRKEQQERNWIKSCGPPLLSSGPEEARVVLSTGYWIVTGKRVPRRNRFIVKREREREREPSSSFSALLFLLSVHSCRVPQVRSSQVFFNVWLWLRLLQDSGTAAVFSTSKARNSRALAHKHVPVEGEGNTF